MNPPECLKKLITLITPINNNHLLLLELHLSVF